MKIRYTATVTLDDEKYKNLDRAYVRKQVKAILDSMVEAMENEVCSPAFQIFAVAGLNAPDGPPSNPVAAKNGTGG